MTSSLANPSDEEIARMLSGGRDLTLALTVPELTVDETQQLIEEAERLAREKEEMLATLAGSVESKFQDRSSRRAVKEAEWIDSIRLYLGGLSSAGVINTASDFFSDKKVSARPIEHNLVKQKCKTAIAQGLSTQFAGGDKNWDIGPSPQPEADMDPMDAAIKAEKMEATIFDQLNDTKYGPLCRQAYSDRVILGTGIVKGPLPSRFASISYEKADDGQGNIVHIPVHRVKNKPVLMRVDPWFFFPDDTVNDIEDASDAIELHPMSKTQLMKLKKNPGFNEEAINELMQEECREYTNQVFSEYASLTAAGTNLLRNKYAVLEYHGPITKTQLNMLDIEPAYDSTNETYFGEVWVCQGKVLRVELEALAGMFELPYAVCPWLPDPGSIFGFGLPQECRDPQRMANTSLRMILRNGALSSGPSVVINTELVEPLDEVGGYQLGPERIYGTTDYNLQNIEQAFKFFTVPNVTEDLMPIFQLARELGQEESGTPAIAAGMNSPSVGSDSATGLAIVEQNSTTINDFLAEDWDDKVTYKIINRMYHYNMQFNPDPEIKGDYEVDVRSSTDFRRQQMSVRDMEKISVEAGNNPELGKLINMQNLQKARLQAMHIPNTGIIKSDDQIKQEEEEARQNPPPDPVMIELQMKQQELALKARELDQKDAAMQLEMQKLQFEVTTNQQREMWEHEERMAANVMRGQEAQARVLEAQLLRETEMIKLANADELNRQKIMADLAKTSAQEETKKFLAGQKTQTEFAKLTLTREEMQLKREEGEGI
jgi:hypothetical protein